jgi:hypothetical protein
VITTEAFNAFIASVEESAVTASGDINSIDSILPRWQVVAQTVVLPNIEQTYLSGALFAYTMADGKSSIPASAASGWAKVVNQQAVEYAAQATNRLTGVGNTLWNDIRRKVSKAIETGASGEQLKEQIEALGQFSEYRADTIGRTETAAAYINGNWTSDQALGEYGPVEKIWVASGDARARASHLSAMAASEASPVPFSQPFTVGGVQMMFPHSPGAPAGEVVNCRCHYESLYVGDQRPDGSIVGEPLGAIRQPEPQLSLQPEQFGGDDGDPFDKTIETEAIYRELGLTEKRLPPEELEALVTYQKSGYREINAVLRRKADVLDELSAERLAEAEQNIRNLDALIDRTPGLEADTWLYRGVEGDLLEAIASQGVGGIVTDAGYQSTSFVRSQAERFAGRLSDRGGAVLRIAAPKGQKGIVMSAARSSGLTNEYEFLLPKGTSLRIIERKQTANGLEILVEIV